jgi:hypothetical protein
LSAANRERRGDASVDSEYRFRSIRTRQSGLDISAKEAMAMTDREALSALNTDYINAVQNGDVRRFDEILAGEFYCSNPDGSLVDRAGSLPRLQSR